MSETASFQLITSMERKFVDTVGTVPVPWAGHFHKHIFRIKYMPAFFIKQHSETRLWFEIGKMLIAVLKNKFIVLFIMIFGTLLFPMAVRLS